MRQFFLSLLFMSLAQADQAAYVSEEVAEKAAKLLAQGTEIRHFCEPCHDAEPRPETVEKTEVKYTGNESFYELYVNGQPVDLAYVFVPVEGVYTNLAQHLGVQVEDVSLVLGEGETYDEEGMYAGGDLRRLHFLGTIGDKKVLMDLVLMEQGVSGSYQYLHIGELLFLEGSVDKEGKADLTESVEEKTGQFIGQLAKDLKTFKGKWVSPDGKRSVDFAMERVAVAAQEVNNASTIGARTTSSLDYPLFTAGAAAENLSAHIQDYVVQRHRAHVKDILAAAAEDLQLEVAEDSLQLSQSMDIGGYQFAYYDGTFLSFSLSEYSFTGGAHGNSATHTLNLLAGADGKLKPLTLKEIFTDADAALSVLSAALIEDLKKQEAGWIVDGQTKEFGWDDLAAWTIDGKGLTFYFDPYAVGAYAQGMFIVTVPKKLMAAHLNPEVLPEALAR